MANFEFRYGSMNSGKSMSLMQVAYNYEENNMKVLVIKPKIVSACILLDATHWYEVVIAILIYIKLFACIFLSTCNLELDYIIFKLNELVISV